VRCAECHTEHHQQRFCNGVLRRQHNNHARRKHGEASRAGWLRMRGMRKVGKGSQVVTGTRGMWCALALLAPGITLDPGRASGEPFAQEIRRAGYEAATPAGAENGCCTSRPIHSGVESTPKVRSAFSTA
jgi:hypothetical protein